MICVTLTLTIASIAINMILTRIDPAADIPIFRLLFLSPALPYACVGFISAIVFPSCIFKSHPAQKITTLNYANTF